MLFLNCPFLSIYNWNKHKGFPCHDLVQFEAQNQRLHQTIDYFNRKIRALNDVTCPQLELDIIKTCKSSRCRRVKSTKKFLLLIDGIHPGTDLSTLWLYRVVHLKHRFEHMILGD